MNSLTMKTKISKAQLEVWEAKDNLYEELKNIPYAKRIEYLQDKAKKSLAKFFKDKIVSMQSQS